MFAGISAWKACTRPHGAPRGSIRDPSANPAPVRPPDGQKSPQGIPGRARADVADDMAESVGRAEITLVASAHYREEPQAWERCEVSTGRV